jgi:transcriptional regulator GlxA family with amidase domain
MIERLVGRRWQLRALDDLRRRYPDVEVRVDRMVIDHGDVITSGGATVFLNLVLHLVERFGRHERANLAAKVLLVDSHRRSQLPYLAALPGRFHDDRVVHLIQQYIDTHLDEPLQIGKLAAQFALSRRTLSRRFESATGRGPQAYVQHTRISTPSDCSRRRATRSTRSAVAPDTSTQLRSAGRSS